MALDPLFFFMITWNLCLLFFLLFSYLIIIMRDIIFINDLQRAGHTLRSSPWWLPSVCLSLPDNCISMRSQRLSSPSNYFYLYFFREEKHPSKIESSKKSFILQRHIKESYFYYNFNLIYIYFHIVKYFYFLYKKISLFSHKKSLSFFLFDKLPNYVLLNVFFIWSSFIVLFISEHSHFFWSVDIDILSCFFYFLI